MGQEDLRNAPHRWASSLTDRLVDDDATRVREVVPVDGRSALRSGVSRDDLGLLEGSSEDADRRALRGGGQRTPWRGRTDGGALGEHRITSDLGGPSFELALSRDGYAWWYLDGVSDCGRYAVTAITFLGSVFSPSYAAARRRGPADPLAFPAINIALYDRVGRSHWVFTEHRRDSLHRSESSLEMAGTSLRRSGQEVELTFDERTSPFPRLDARRLEGSIKLCADDAAPALPIVLDETGRHLWWPVAPRARISVDVPSIGLRWSGTGYHDANAGERPLERDFARWTWGRFYGPNGEIWILYDALLRSGERTSQLL